MLGIPSSRHLSLLTNPAPQSSLPENLRAKLICDAGALFPRLQRMMTPKAAPLFRQLYDAESSTYTYLLANTAGEALLIDPVLEQVGEPPLPQPIIDSCVDPSLLAHPAQSVVRSQWCAPQSSASP